MFKTRFGIGGTQGLLFMVTTGYFERGVLLFQVPQKVKYKKNFCFISLLAFSGLFIRITDSDTAELENSSKIA